jgi:hypothetical protein
MIHMPRGGGYLGGRASFSNFLENLRYAAFALPFLRAPSFDLSSLSAITARWLGDFAGTPLGQAGADRVRGGEAHTG